MRHLRQTRADFDTPGHTVGGALSLDRRPDALAWDHRTAFSAGPRGVGDASAGLVDRVWKARAEGGAVYLARADDGNTAWEAEALLFRYDGAPVVELDLAFDQNGRALVCAERATGAGGGAEVWLYWYNPLPEFQRFTFDNLGPGRTPRVLLDDVHDLQNSDLLLFYVHGDALVYREQRDRFAARRATPLAGAGLYLEAVAKARDGRVHVFASRRDAATGAYTLEVLESTLYPFLQTERFELGGSLQETGALRTALFIAEVNEPFVLGGAMLRAGALREPVIVLGPLHDGERFTVAGRLSGAGSLVDVYRRLEHTTGAEAFTMGGRMRPDVGSLTQLVIVQNPPGGESYTLNGALQPSGSLVNV